jgi:hypothetical protein
LIEILSTEKRQQVKANKAAIHDLKTYTPTLCLDCRFRCLQSDDKDALKPELDSSSDDEDDYVAKSDDYADDWTGDDVDNGEELWEVAPSDDSPGKKGRGRSKGGTRKKASPVADKAKRQKVKVEHVPLNCSICGELNGYFYLGSACNVYRYTVVYCIL